MKDFFYKHGKEVAFSLIIVVCLVFFINIIAQEKTYSDSVDGQAVEKAEFYSLEQSIRLESRVNSIKAKANVLASALASATSEQKVWETLARTGEIIGYDSNFKTVYYYQDGRLYNAYGMEADADTYPDIKALETVSGTVMTRLFQYENTLMALAVSAPVGGILDRVVLIYDRKVLTPFLYEEGTAGMADCFSHADFTLFCKHDGRILESVVNREGYSIGNEPVQAGLLQDLITDREAFEQVDALIRSGGTGSVTCRIGSEKYVLTVNSCKNAGGLFLVSLYDMADVYGSGYEFVNSIWGTLLVFFALMLFISISFIAGRVTMHRKIFEIGAVDSRLHCPTLMKFGRDAEEILHDNKVSQFAVIVARINNFSYVSDRFGEQLTTELLTYARDVYKNSLLIGETYAYNTDGEFVLLMHYKDRKGLIDRLTGVSSRISRYQSAEHEDFRVKVSFSVYEIERSIPQSVHRMLDKAMAIRYAGVDVNGELSCSFYNDVVGENYMKKAEIEGEMESALRNSEFHIFYQPKYSFDKNTISGSEVLVRWYDSKNEVYHQPGVFLPVFEENGFINQLDRFVFYKACENMAECLKNNIPIFPISVNVSRVTATQPDFIEYYARIKNKFRVGDGFITLEFTESFAYENYEYLAAIVTKLHENGFVCSLDDFGTGYSSYNLLKTMEMDEIKLDKIFLQKGISEKRDRQILESIITLVKDLGMTVTQEGVETEQEFETMRSLGCDLIQGYYFAKPMKFVHYCEFKQAHFSK